VSEDPVRLRHSNANNLDTKRQSTHQFRVGGASNYHARMQRVLDYIDQHLDGDLDLETVSRVALWASL
jgi:hypothetical protein